jgi:hypothetical protein
MDKCRWITRPRLERARSKGDEVSDPRQRSDTARVFRRTISNPANASETTLLLSSVRTDYWMVLPIKIVTKNSRGWWMMSVCSGGPNDTASKKQIRGLSCIYPSTYGTTAPSGPWPPSEHASESVYAIQYSPATMIKQTSTWKCETGMYFR